MPCASVQHCGSVLIALERSKFAGVEKILLPSASAPAIMLLTVMEIMSPSVSYPVRFSALVCCSVLLLASQLFAVDSVLQRVPPLTVEQAPAYPQNLARYDLGAQIEAASRIYPTTSLQLSLNSEDGNTSEAALLCDDPTVGYPLANGSTTLLISLSKIENINKISFLNGGAKGEVTVATSSTKLPPDSARWHETMRQELTSNVITAKVGPSDAKYVKLTFNISEPGRIAGLGVYSTPAIADFTMPRTLRAIQNNPEGIAFISYNLSDVHAKARALYVSSGADLQQANNMIDNQPGTTYSFSADDAAPTAVIDLGKDTTVRRVSATYSQREARVDFYVLQTLPGTQADHAVAPKTLRLTDNIFAGLRPVGSVADTGKGRAAVDFEPVTGRYIVVRWSPTSRQDTAFSVDEIAVFSGNGSKSLVAANSMVSSDGKEGKDFGEGKEAKEMPEEGPPAEGPPPTLPDPPPFVFAPEIVPTSP